VAWYRKAARLKKETAKDLQDLEQGIRKLIDRYFPKGLKAWIKDRERFEGKRLDLLSYLLRSQATLLEKSSAEEFQANFPTLSLILEIEKAKEETAVERLKKVDHRSLFREIEELEKFLSDKYLSEERDQKTFQYYRGLALLKRLNELEVTFAEYEAVKDSLQGLETQALADFIAKHTKRLVVLSKKWQENIQRGV
jgi:hypothetical protein